MDVYYSTYGLLVVCSMFSDVQCNEPNTRNVNTYHVYKPHLFLFVLNYTWLTYNLSRKGELLNRKCIYIYTLHPCKYMCYTPALFA